MPIKPRRFGDLISYQNDRKYFTACSREAEVVSEYSNAWIDMRHDNALNSAMSGVSRGINRGRRGLGQVPEAM